MADEPADSHFVHKGNVVYVSVLLTIQNHCWGNALLAGTFREGLMVAFAVQVNFVAWQRSEGAIWALLRWRVRFRTLFLRF